MSAERFKGNSLATTHGLRNHPLYQNCLDAIHRCRNENHKEYPNYGGTGIAVAPEWRDDLPKMILDVAEILGEQPTPQHTIDRINPWLGYTRGNLRWADKTQQIRNRKLNWPISADEADDSEVFAIMAAAAQGGAA